MTLDELEVRRALALTVPCDGCTLCCHGDAIRILPGDDVAQYQTVPHERYAGELMLDHKPNGDCIYLAEHGCSIHGRAPRMCREMDCRTIASTMGYTPARKMGVISVWRRGKRLIGPRW